MISDLILLLGLTVPTVLLFRRLRMPSIAGILTVGAVVGPHGLRWVERTEEVEKLAEVGVMLLLFTIGLEFSLPRFFVEGKRLIASGASQMLLTIGLVAGVSFALGRDTREAILLGLLVAPSSTAFVLKVLNDTKQIDGPHGSFTVGILLFQDLCVIPMMLVLPLLAGVAGAGALSVALALGKAVVALFSIVVIARYVFPRVAREVMKLGGRELFTLFIVLTALGAAWATEQIGLSLALGAFVAGLFIAESEYSHQVISEILPFRDVTNALFFASIGMLFDIRIVLDQPLWTLLLVGVLVVGKAAIVLPIAYRATESFTVAALSSAALAQVGEFSFVLLTQSEHLGLVAEHETSRFLAVAILSMMSSPFVIQFAPALLRRLRPAKPKIGEDGKPAHGSRVDVIVLGYGLNGENVSRVLTQCGVSFRVIELSIQRANLARSREIPVLFGDGSRSDVLEHAGIESASTLVITLSDPAAARRALAVARRMSPNIHVIVRTRYVSEREELMRLGANEIIPEELETSLAIFARVLKRLGVPRGNIAVQVELMRREGYQVLLGETDTARSLDLVRDILAETTVETIRVPDHSPLVGRALAEVELRARTGAAVISAVRDSGVVHAPGGDFILTPDCVLVVTGNHEQIARCRDFITGTKAD